MHTPTRPSFLYPCSCDARQLDGTLSVPLDLPVMTISAGYVFRLAHSGTLFRLSNIRCKVNTFFPYEQIIGMLYIFTGNHGLAFTVKIDISLRHCRIIEPSIILNPGF